MKTSTRLTRSLLIAGLVALTAQAEEVNLYNFVRAETDFMIRMNLQHLGIGVGEIAHRREPVTAESQTVIRPNQDTLYSSAVIDLQQPATVTLPEIGGRYMSMHVINQDHYMFVESEPGSYELSEQSVGTRFAALLFRTFADGTDPVDVEKAHAAQDGITIEGGGSGSYDAPDWNTDELAVIRGALNDVAALGFDSTYAFGSEQETRPIDHLVGAAAGWAGLPKTAAYYVLDSVDANDGETPHSVTVGDVPVAAFWSVTVYNEDGYLEANESGRNSYNNYTAQPNDDGTITIHFGSCDDGRVNCLPITPGWNHAIRMYQPKPEILEGRWAFPAIEPVG